MENPNILNKIRDILYDYKYLLRDYDYSVFIETVINEMNKILKK